LGTLEVFGNTGFFILPKKRFKTITDKNVHAVEFEGFRFKTLQVCQSYDAKRKFHSGFLLTPFSLKEIRTETRTQGRGSLYIKGWDRNRGLWEITYPDTQLKQLEEDMIWFRSNGASSFMVLKGINNSDVDD
tara:strand:+ start:889 stop:1284 length:396 start_codon:yes stop_codon:yes gene_type:complete